jgi:hypothetical protein
LVAFFNCSSNDSNESLLIDYPLYVLDNGAGKSNDNDDDDDGSYSAYAGLVAHHKVVDVRDHIHIAFPVDYCHLIFDLDSSRLPLSLNYSILFNIRETRHLTIKIGHVNGTILFYIVYRRISLGKLKNNKDKGLQLF